MNENVSRILRLFPVESDSQFKLDILKQFNSLIIMKNVNPVPLSLVTSLKFLESLSPKLYPNVSFTILTNCNVCVLIRFKSEKFSYFLSVEFVSPWSILLVVSVNNVLSESSVLNSVDSLKSKVSFLSSKTM